VGRVREEREPLGPEPRKQEETQLSTDGATDWAYAVVPEGCCSEITNRRRKFRPPPVLKWSPDSKRIATHRYDERNVEKLYLLETATGRPKLHSWHYAMPGDSVTPTFEIYVFDVGAKRGVKVQVEKQPGNFTAADSVFPEVRWVEDGSSLFVTTRSRDFRKIELFRADPASGTTQKVLTGKREDLSRAQPVPLPRRSKLAADTERRGGLVVVGARWVGTPVSV
jgi:Tol biopolymer transport system component